MADCIRIKNPWGRYPLQMEENFVEISGKVSVWNGSGEVIEFYPEERGRLDAGHQGTTPPPPLFTEMPFVFEGDPARPRVRTIHVLWDDLIDGKGTIQIQARVKYQSFLPASFLKGPTHSWFVWLSSELGVFLHDWPGSR